MKKVAIASDHAGYDLKSFLINHFAKDYKIMDLGCDNGSEPVDYPDFAQKLCKKILTEKIEFGILICGSGVGISIAANRFKKIRAALCHNEETAILSRAHNNANVICLGSRLTKPEQAVNFVDKFLNSQFEGDRHLLRISKIDNE